MLRRAFLLVSLSVFCSQLAWGQAVIPLKEGASVERDLPVDALHAYTLDLAAQQFVSGAADQQSIDVRVSIYGPEGNLRYRHSGSVRGAEPFQFNTDVAGTYRLVIAPREREAGRYALRVHRIEPIATTTEGRVDQLMAPYDHTTPGGVIVVLRGGEILFARGYGMADLERGVPNSPASVYNLASVSKQFTGFAIAQLAHEGKLSIDDDVRAYIPEMPQFGKTITLRHLLNHTSGLREQWTLWELSGGRMDDVIRREDLLRLVERQRELNFDPGTEYLYSNTGYTLLAEVVERVTGTSFRDWMQEKVFEPLDMKSAQVLDSYERIVPGRAYSYEYAQGGFKEAVLNHATPGATNVLASAEDLVKWFRNFKTPVVGGDGALQRMQEPGVLANGAAVPYGFGIGIAPTRGLRSFGHQGSVAGYRTSVRYFPDIDAGLIVLGNVGAFLSGYTLGQVGLAFAADLKVPRQAQPASDGRPGSEVPGELLDLYSGTFTVEDGALKPWESIRFERSGKQLVAKLPGQPDAVLAPLADTLFGINALGRGARLSFHIGSDGRVVRASIRGAGTTRLKRAEAAPPAREAPARYEGRYFSPELETLYTVTAKNGQLVIRHRRHGEAVLTPGRQDTFEVDGWIYGTVAFSRDAAGAINEMRVSGWGVSNLRFEKER